MNSFLSILCSIFIIGALWIGVYNYRFLRASKAIEARVVGIDTTTTSINNSSNRHMPIIEYTNPEGKKSQFTASVSSLNCKIGNKVWIAYNEATKKEKLLSLGEIFLPLTIFLLFGIVLILILLPLPKSSQITYWILKIFNLLTH